MIISIGEETEVQRAWETCPVCWKEAWGSPWVSLSPYSGLAARSRAHPIHGCGSQGRLRKAESVWAQRRNLIIRSAQNAALFAITELSTLELSGARQGVFDFWVSIRGVDCAPRQDLKEGFLPLRSWEVRISSSSEIIQIHSMQVETRIRKRKIWSNFFFNFKKCVRSTKYFLS